MADTTNIVQAITDWDAARLIMQIDWKITTHLFSIERADWPKLHDMFQARDAKAQYREFPLRFLVGFCASN